MNKLNNPRPLDGVKVVELAVFIAAPCATRFFADQGAEVIKIENLEGDGIRNAKLAEGRPELPNENIVFDIENGNKKAVSMNLKNPDCYAALMKMLENADIFVTSWRAKALEKLGLDYDSLKKKFPKLVYGSVTGYGDKGPDKDLPGFDYTAFWARSGMLGSLYEKGTVPINLIPSMGDRQVGMNLAAGLLAALFNAMRTGKGEKVSVSLLGTAIFTQATMIQCTQYGKVKYPLSKANQPHPLNNNFRTKDGRFVQISMPMFERMFPPFAKLMGHEEWLTDERFIPLQDTFERGYSPDLYNTVQDAILDYEAVTFKDMMLKNDLPCEIAYTWDEVLEDPQAWADDCFLNMEYESGSRVLVRHPVHFEEAGLPPYIKGPDIGQDTVEILKSCGFSDEKIANLKASGDIKVSD